MCICKKQKNKSKGHHFARTTVMARMKVSTGALLSHDASVLIRISSYAGTALVPDVYMKTVWLFILQASQCLHLVHTTDTSQGIDPFIL